MRLETELNIALTEFFRPIVAQCVQEAIHKLGITPAPPHQDVDLYGDFQWLRDTCSGVPTSTLRIKSAKGQIPGVVKFGKRVLYEKATVLEWLRSQTRVATPDVTELSRVADEQVSRQLAKGRGISA